MTGIFAVVIVLAGVVGVVGVRSQADPGTTPASSATPSVSVPPAPTGAASATTMPSVPWPTEPGIHVVAGSPTCIDDWSGGRAGDYTFQVANDEGDELEIYLQDVRTKRVYLEVENFGRDAIRRVSAAIPPGTYRWVCITSYTIKSSRPVHVTGPALDQPVHGIVPTTPLDLRVPILRYTAWVRGRLPALRGQVGRLAADLHGGDVGAAKRAWLAAHLTYETLGAAYGAFGALDDAIDADPPTDPGEEARFTGFRRIEQMLWSGAPAAEIAPYGEALVEAVRRLGPELAKPNSITPLDMGVRAHEILEDALQHDLAGVGDAGSHTELATLDANLTGTWHALDPLLPLLRRQDPYLPRTEQWLEQTQALVRSHDHAGHWTPLPSLTAAQRAALNAHVQEAVELLSHVSVVTEPRNPTGDVDGGELPGEPPADPSGGDGK